METGKDLLECKHASKGQSELVPSSAVHHERWMINGQETVFLFGVSSQTDHGGLVQLPIKLPILTTCNSTQAVKTALAKYKPSNYLLVTYFLTYIVYLYIGPKAYKMGYKGETQYQGSCCSSIFERTINELSIQWMDGALVGAGSLSGSK